MEHTTNQYDDDLTAGNFNSDFSSGNVDLFDYISDDESPLSRLKTLVLSIDWEITDEVLYQFNEELDNLKELWQEEKVNLVYVQALEKISKYIYKEKSQAHPNAIKLLLTLYTNLEKVVSDESLSELEKKKILLEDVQRFEHLKKIIAGNLTKDKPQPQVAQQVAPGTEDAGVAPAMTGSGDSIPQEPVPPIETPPPPAAEKKDPLLELKAIVYAIDWEVTDKDLAQLSDVVAQLEDTFKGSKAKLIFLQGLGALGTYIRARKGDSHIEAFKLLQSFYGGLERVVTEGLIGRAEKNVLMPEVEKFNHFKEIILQAQVAESGEDGDDEYNSDEETDEAELQPAFAEVPAGVHGFRVEDDEQGESDGLFSQELEEEEPEYTDDDQEAVLVEEMESRLAGMFQDTADFRSEETVIKSVDAEKALAGVNVESEEDDDSDETPLPFDGDEIAPALSADSDEHEPRPVAAISDELEPRSAAATYDEITGPIEDFFEDEQDTQPETGMVDSLEDTAGQELFAYENDENDLIQNDVIPGVDVETSADDDSAEEPLPYEEGEIAPALFSEEFARDDDGDDVQSAFSVDTSDDQDSDRDISEADLNGRLENFFAESEDDLLGSGAYDALAGVDVEDEDGEAADAVAGIRDPSVPEFAPEKSPEEDLIGQDLFHDADTEEERGEELLGMPEQLPSAAVDPETMTESINAFLLEDDTADLDVVYPDVAEVAEEGRKEESEEVVFELVTDEFAEAASQPYAEHLANVRSMTAQEGGFDLSALNAEIENLQQIWENCPSEKTYLHLLSTVCDRIDKNGTDNVPPYERLLQSIMDKLEICAQGHDSGAGVQEALLAETSKVLDWQQQIINLSSSRLDLPAESEESEDAASGGDSSALDDMSDRINSLGDELLMQKVSSVMRSELDTLKQAFQQELKELRDEIARKK